MARGLTAGYDPYAAPIVGAANTIMQGVDYFEGQKEKQQQQAWQDELRQRQREQWDRQDIEFQNRQEDRESNLGWTEESRSRKRQEWEDQDQSKADEEMIDSFLTGMMPQGQDDPFSQHNTMVEKVGPVSKQARFEKLPPRLQGRAIEKAIDLQSKVYRNRNEMLALHSKRASMALVNATKNLQGAAFLLEQGNSQGAAQALMETYNSYFPDSKKATINEDGKIQIKNTLTGEGGDIELNANNPQDLKKAIGMMAQVVSNPQEFVKGWYLNSEVTQQERNKAMKTPETLTTPDGQIVYRVVMPNSEGKFDALYFDHKPDWNSKSLELSREEQVTLIPEGYKKEKDKEDERLKVTDSKTIKEMVADVSNIASIPEGKQRGIAAEVERLVSKEGATVNEAINYVFETNRDELLASVPEDAKDDVWNKIGKFLWKISAAGVAAPIEAGKKLKGLSGGEDKDAAKNKVGGLIQSSPQNQSSKPEGLPPDAKQAKDGNWYVLRDGKYYRVEP